jgi:hypothetical protein
LIEKEKKVSNNTNSRRGTDLAGGVTPRHD